MSKWVGKYVIGLTGNIATGKSVVRKMLEHLGGYGIDADKLAHRVIAKGAAGYRPVADTFGVHILDEDGQIDRRQLGKIVFNDPEALSRLEAIIHPLVKYEIDLLIEKTWKAVVIIEAIKLIEAGIGDNCDRIWVTYSPSDLQLERLIKNRQMSEAEAKYRIAAQPDQEQKMAMANVVIHNTNKHEDTWRQVCYSWENTIPENLRDSGSVYLRGKDEKNTKMRVVCGKREHAKDIIALYRRANSSKLLETDIDKAIDDQALLVLLADHNLNGVIRWQIRNMVSQAMDLAFDPDIAINAVFQMLVDEVGKIAYQHRCTTSMLILKPEFIVHDELFASLGYQRQCVGAIENQTWKEAAEEAMAPGLILYVKPFLETRDL